MCGRIALFLLKMVNWQFGWIFQNKNKNFLSVNGQMVVQMTCVEWNDISAVLPQTQAQTETEGYRMHNILIGQEIIKLSSAGGAKDSKQRQ